MMREEVQIEADEAFNEAIILKENGMYVAIDLTWKWMRHYHTESCACLR